MPDAGGYSNTTIGRSAPDAISEKWRRTMSGLSWAPHMNKVGGKTRTPAAPAVRASRARSTASCVPSEYTPAMTGHAPPTSSSAIASERLRSSRFSDDTSEAWPLATMPVTPRVSASQRRCRRYAGSSIVRSDVKGSTLAGMTPEKRSGSFITVSSPARDLVDDFLGGDDAAVRPPDDVQGGPLDLWPQRGHAVLDQGDPVLPVQRGSHRRQHADIRHRTGHHERSHVPGPQRRVEEGAGERVVAALTHDDLAGTRGQIGHGLGARGALETRGRRQAESPRRAR